MDYRKFRYCRDFGELRLHFRDFRSDLKTIVLKITGIGRPSVKSYYLVLSFVRGIRLDDNQAER